MRKIGCDLSHHNLPERCNYERMATQIDFAIVRTNYGTTDDRSFQRHVAGLRSRGVQVGFYAFCLLHQCPHSFAESVAANMMLCDVKDSDLPIFLDLEKPPASSRSYELHEAMSPAARVSWAHRAEARLVELLGHQVGIYSGANYWRTRMANTTEFAHLPLWAARYPLGRKPLDASEKSVPAKEPAKFGGWSDWKIWQYTGDGRLPGYNGKRVDLDVMQVDEAPSSLCSL